MFRKTKHAALISIAVLIMAVAEPAPAQNGDIKFMEQQSELLQHDADSARAQAEKLRSQAAQYRELAEAAKRNAAQASSPRDREDWEQTARQHREKAGKLESDAVALDEKAQKAASDATDLQNQIETKKAKNTEKQQAYDRQAAEIAARETPPPEEENTDDYCMIQSPSWLNGLWRFEDSGKSKEGFAIVQNGADPQSTGLELHSQGRIWKGAFRRSGADGPRVIFTYKPKADEINQDIPDKARQAIAGTLEWELEIHDECVEDALTPHAIFYPGEVSWEDDGENPEVTGRGEGRRKNIFAETHIWMEKEAQAFIGVSLGAGHDYISNPVEALTKGQRFYAVVVLPEEMAKEAGKSLSVTLTGQNGGESDTIELEAGATMEGRSVTYMSRDPATLADSTDAAETDRKPRFMSLNWLFGNSGDRLRLDAENGEIVRFSYGDIHFDVPLYNSWVQRGLARFAEAEQRLRAVYESVAAGPYSAEQKSAAQRRLKMLDNYLALVASDKLNDVHRYRLGELYLGDDAHKSGIVQMTDEALEAAYEDPRTRSFERSADPEFFNPMVKAFLEGVSGRDLTSQSGRAATSIDWVYPAEQQMVESTIRTATRRLQNDLLKETYKNLSFGMYDGLVAATQTGDYYLLATGKDAFGRPAPGWMRATVAVGIASGAILKLNGAMQSAKFTKALPGKPYGLTKVSKGTLRKTGTQGAHFSANLTPPAVPGTVSAAQAERLQVHIVPTSAPGASVGGPDFAELPRETRLPPLAPPRPMPLNFPKNAAPEPPANLPPVPARPGPLPALPQPQKQSLPPDLAQDRLQSAMPQNPKAAKSAPAPLNPREAAKLLDEIMDEDIPEKLDPHRFDNHPRAQYIKSHYPDMVKIHEDYGGSYALQTHSTCQAKALEWIIKKRTGFEVGQVELQKILLHIIEKEGTPQQLARLGGNYKNRVGILHGYDNWMINKLAEWFGMKAGDLKPGLNATFKIENLIPVLEKKMPVKAVIKLNSKSGHALHAVSVEDVVVNRFGMVSKVRFFDSNVGAVLELPGPVFQKMLLDRDLGYGAVTIFE